ncbi:MAG: aminoglycoside phosphotransferase family protein [Nocardioides sp.]|nr:aminoglycoside phosphotransferase family protein [Nocardioides sp.]
MHDNDVITTADQVRRLVAAQFPQWADLPVTPVAEFGTDHLLWRLGDNLVARMPRIEWAVDQADSDARWLPLLASHLPLGVPVTVAVGEPGEGYPWRWSVVRWLPGEALTPDNVDAEVVATQLAGFVRALAAIEPGDGPLKTGTARGVPLANLEGWVDEWLPRLEGFDRSAVRAAWRDCLDAPAYDGPPRWIHGDLLRGNLLVRDRRLSAVIDWGAIGLGDPATDLHTAYTLFEPAARAVFREQMTYDDDAWRRARGWALAPAISGVTYYSETVPAFSERGRWTIQAVLAEF